MNILHNVALEMRPNKDVICILGGVAGSVVTFLFGGWSKGLSTLFFFIAVDYFTGMIGAAVFKKSSKTKKGGLSSSVGTKGIWSKVGIIIAVACMHHVDLMSGKELFMNAAVFGFCTNEVISIIENLGKQWGVKFPPIVMNAIEVLNIKAGEMGKK